MTKRELIDLCLGLPNAYEDYPFYEVAPTWAAIRHKGNKKIFANIFQCETVADGNLCISIKLNPFESDILRQSFESIKPAYHLNKEHWSMVQIGGDVPIELLRDLIQKSYDITKPKIKARKHNETF
jgi:predicted DNA-binding protein (MmcQ/YjbR family)